MGDTNETIERLLRDQKPWAACDIAKARIAELERGVERDKRIVELDEERDDCLKIVGQHHERIVELRAALRVACKSIVELRGQIKLNVDYAKRVAELETRLALRRLPRMDDGQTWDPR